MEPETVNDELLEARIGESNLPVVVCFTASVNPYVTFVDDDGNEIRKGWLFRGRKAIQEMNHKLFRISVLMKDVAAIIKVDMAIVPHNRPILKVKKNSTLPVVVVVANGVVKGKMIIQSGIIKRDNGEITIANWVLRTLGMNEIPTEKKPGRYAYRSR